MNPGSVLQHKPHRPIRPHCLRCRPAVRREAGIHRLDVLQRTPNPTRPVKMCGQPDGSIDGRRQGLEAFPMQRATNSPGSLDLRLQFQVWGLLGREADAVRLGGYLSLRFFQFTQPVFQVHLSPPIVPAAARNQQPRRLVAAPYPDSRACCRARGPSSRPEYQPSFRPASALRPRPIPARRHYERRRCTPYAYARHLCDRARLRVWGLSGARTRRCPGPLERHTDGPLSSSLGTCHLPLGAVLAAWVIPPPYPTRLDHLSSFLANWTCRAFGIFI